MFSATIHWYLIFLHRPEIIHIWDRLWKMTESEKLQRLSQRKQGIYHTCPYSILLITAPCPSKYAEGYSIAASMAMFLLNSPAWNFSFATFQSVSFFINRCQTWSVYGLFRKMRYQNVDEKFRKRLCNLCYHTITRFIVTSHASADYFVCLFVFLGIYFHVDSKCRQ